MEPSYCPIKLEQFFICPIASFNRMIGPAQQKIRIRFQVPLNKGDKYPFLSPEVIRMVVMRYVRFLHSLRNEEDLLAKLG